MDNKIIKMQVEILDLNKIEQYKEMLKKTLFLTMKIFY